MKALPLLKHNIDTLLKARSQTRRDLAMWVRQSMDKKKIDPWISHIFTNPDAEFQMKYLDRIADFFGLAVYQLFQPGIADRSERRSGSDRRKRLDRRVSAAVISQKALDVDIIHIVRALQQEGRQKAIGILMDILNDEIAAFRGPQTTAADAGAQGRTAETPRAGRARRRR